MPQLSPMVWWCFPIMLGVIMVSLMGVVDKDYKYEGLDEELCDSIILSKKW